MMEKTLPTYEDVQSAYQRIKTRIVKTPLIENAILNALCGGRVFLKAENLQHTGSFKFRGASNALLSLSKDQRDRGVIACSSGNHAQGIAEVGRLLGIKTTILMPQDSPQSKLLRTKRSGAEIITYDRLKEDREVLIEALAKTRKMTLIHPFDDSRVIAGQGTIAIEMAEQLEALDVVPDVLLSGVGGGGLIAGVTLGMKQKFPNLDIHCCEPENFDDYGRSLKAAAREVIEGGQNSICDAILTPSPGKLSFEICKTVLSEGLVVSDLEALRAVKFAFEELKLVVEPGGAVSLAALLSKKIDLCGKTAVALITGGNIDGDMMARALQSE